MAAFWCNHFGDCRLEKSFTHNLFLICKHGHSALLLQFPSFHCEGRGSLTGRKTATPLCSFPHCLTGGRQTLSLRWPWVFTSTTLLMDQSFSYTAQSSAHPTTTTVRLQLSRDQPFPVGCTSWLAHLISDDPRIFLMGPNVPTCLTANVHRISILGPFTLCHLMSILNHCLTEVALGWSRLAHSSHYRRFEAQ